MQVFSCSMYDMKLNFKLISVEAMPSGSYGSHGRSLPTPGNDGIYYQHNEFIHQYTCNTTMCVWKKINIELGTPVFGAFMTYLPDNFPFIC